MNKTCFYIAEFLYNLRISKIFEFKFELNQNYIELWNLTENSINIFLSNSGISKIFEIKFKFSKLTLNFRTSKKLLKNVKFTYET